MTADIENRAQEETEEIGHEETVDEFKKLMYDMQEVRRKLVITLLNDARVPQDELRDLTSSLALLRDSRTSSDGQRHMTASSQSFSVNINDEIVGLTKDVEFLNRLAGSDIERTVEEVLGAVDLDSILAPYHPVSPTQFHIEVAEAVKFLDRFVSSSEGDDKPIFITDWDGTMKNYCSQYATNVQPVYSAVCMARFAAFTRLAAVLTAGPLRGPGILDLTSLPIDGPLIFSGSWGREWWLRGRRIVHDDGVSEEGLDALQRLSDEMSSLLGNGEYSQFGLVGSGVQRKVDRLTLGVQTVCGHVEPDLSERYQDAVKERMHRVDPYNKILVFDRSTELEVEVCLHSSGSVWNKGDGVARLLQSTRQSLQHGKVLIAGDTSSDLPMLAYALEQNPEGTMALFVGEKEELRERVRVLVQDESRCCFVSCPDVFHSAVAHLLISRSLPSSALQN